MSNKEHPRDDLRDERGGTYDGKPAKGLAKPHILTARRSSSTRTRRKVSSVSAKTR